MPTARGDLIHDVNAVAAGLGLAPGQRATDAAAAHHDLAVAYADPAYEKAALVRLAAWARRWSPSTRADGRNGIALDATGCAHLFGGETAMLDAIGKRLADLKLTARLAVAPNHAAAHALARFGASQIPAAALQPPVVAFQSPVVAAEADLASLVSPLPIEALRLDAASITLLRRLGLKTIGDLDRVPRASLKKRFGARRKNRDPRDDTHDDFLGRSAGEGVDVLIRLDETMGRISVPFGPERAGEPARLVRGLAEPILEARTVLVALRPMIVALMELLHERDQGVLVLGVEAFRVDGGRASTALRLSRPTRDVDRLMRLLTDRLDGWHAEFGFDALAVDALETAALPPVQIDVVEERHAGDLHALIDRLRTRLGRHAVLHPVVRRHHVPERALAWTLDEERVSADPATGVRPDRMFEHPEEIGVIHALPEGPPARFTWRRSTHDVARVAGPERIAPEWWRERSKVRARDYYRVETRQGRRFWIYRDGFEGDERGGQPRWFMHGLFS